WGRRSRLRHRTAGHSGAASRLPRTPAARPHAAARSDELQKGAGITMTLAHVGLVGSWGPGNDWVWVWSMFPLLIPIVAIVGGITMGIVRTISHHRLIELAQRERI